MHTDVQFWDRIAPRYAAGPIKNMSAYTATLDRVSARLSPTDHVLEQGCGTGTTALELAPRVASYVATDISQGMIEIAQRKSADRPVEGLSFSVAPAVETRFEPNSFDAVLNFNLLHLVADLPAALERAKSLLKPGGLYITKTPCLSEMGLFVRLVVPAMQFFGKAPSATFFTQRELEHAMERSGFELEDSRVFDGAAHVRYLVARKP